ncbi:MAG: TonB-dependent receptor plug domain-containing protein [Bacteroidetes bacterium]|nr:TonB-dependent receptor plug domain-containing protein [Bacteroidota bacterium]
MKKLLSLILYVTISLTAFSQNHIKGKVIDALSGIPVPNATVEIENAGTTLTNDAGIFEFKKINAKNDELKITSIGYKQYNAKIIAVENELLITLEPVQLFLQPVEVRAIRAGEKAPFTKTNISKKEIEKANLGQDLPFILNQTPSVVINSDAGNGVGYTGIYIRGTDATRINMTINGIPYNDAEDQSIYFVDLPDLASSVNSIQIQRGVGTSSNGAGAFGATMNFSTNEFNEKAYAEINNSYGSFNTWKNTIKVGSGLIGDHFTLDARLSRISSNGYIDRATSDLKSFYLSAAYYSKTSSLRFNIISGYEKTYQAWNGIPEAKLEGDKAALDKHYEDNVGSLYFTQADSLNLYNSNNRTYNYFTYKNQTDNYWQNHYQLFFNHQFNSRLSLNVAGFLSRGYGYYEEYQHGQSYADYGLSPVVVGTDTISTTDLIRQKWLDNYFYGGIFSLQYKSKGTQLTIGGGWDRYDGKHYGLVNWAQNGDIPEGYQYYNVPAHKSDFNVYAKWQQQLDEHFTAFADLQFRTINYHINGFEDNPSIIVNPQYNFLNPKAGVSYNSHDWQGYFSYSLGNHEPNRGDFEANQSDLPKPEKLNDFELNIEKKNSLYSLSATGYYMLYKNQLVLNGKINDVGEYTRVNIPNSYRLGVELQGSIKLTNWMNIAANIAFSRNKVKNYTEYIDDYDNGGQKSYSYKTTDIAFSPSVVGGASVNFLPFKNYELNLISKYVSKEYLDNGQHEDRKLNGYYVQNLRMSYAIKSKTIKETDFVFQVNNLFNKKYEPNGYTYSYIYGGELITENFLFPMATTNVMLAINIKL